MGDIFQHPEKGSPKVRSIPSKKAVVVPAKFTTSSSKIHCRSQQKISLVPTSTAWVLATLASKPATSPAWGSSIARCRFQHFAPAHVEAPGIWSQQKSMRLQRCASPVGPSNLRRQPHRHRQASSGDGMAALGIRADIGVRKRTTPSLLASAWAA